MEYIIRPVIMSDVQAICCLNREEMGYDYPLEETEKVLKLLLDSPTDKIFVAEINGETVGYVHAQHYQVLYAPPMKNIMGIAVSSVYRREGIGAALLDRVEQWAREEGCEMVRLVSGASRTGAHEFYRRQGYGEGRTQLNFKKRIQ